MAEEVDFGRTLSCLRDLSAEGRQVTGWTVVAEAIARRWTTPRGRLLGDPNYGFDLSQFLNADVTPRDVVSIQAQAAAEALKDERVEDCTCEVTFAADGKLTIRAWVTTAFGPFEFVTSVADSVIDSIVIQGG